jgi:hypothetical protein
VETPFQNCTNRLKYSRDRVKGIATSYKETIALVASSLINFTWTFVGGPGTNEWGWVQGSSPASSDAVTIPLPTPALGAVTQKILSITVQYRPVTHGTQPATQPEIQLWKQDSGDGAPTAVGSAQGADGSGGAYSALRTVTISAMNHSISSSSTYYLAFKGEGGANSAAGLLLKRIEVEYGV